MGCSQGKWAKRKIYGGDHANLTKNQEFCMMKDISVLLTRHALIAPIGNTHYLFSMVNNYLTDTGRPPIFNVRLVGLEKELKLNDGSYTIRADVTLDEVKHTDLIIIPPMNGEMIHGIDSNKAYVSWMMARYAQGTEIASLCVGAFLLAETGLLNNRQCSTHWKTADEFRSRFPEVNLVDEKIITDHDGLYTSGGANSYWNLLIYLVEKFTDHETAVYASKYFEIHREQNNQSVFRIFKGSKLHEDQTILKVQQFIEQHYTERFTIGQLSELSLLSQRTLQRRFKEATHFTINTYIQKVRVEAAKRLLETQSPTINEVMYEAGYNDPKAFRAIFKKETGVSPITYRTKYNW